MTTNADRPVAPPRSPALVMAPERIIAGLLDISNLVGSVLLLPDILKQITQKCAELMELPICAIYLIDENDRLVLRSHAGRIDPAESAVFEQGHGIIGWCAKHGEVVSLTHPENDPRFAECLGGWKVERGAFLCAPLRIQEDIVGVMAARRRDVVPFTRDETHFFEAICKQVAIVIEKARMYEDKIAAERLAAMAVSLSGIAHYIKNVLFTSEIGEYQVNRGVQDGDLERISRGWASLHEANGRIRKLVEDMLNYVRKQESNKAWTDLNAVIGELAKSIQQQAQRRGVRIVCELDSKLGAVRMNAPNIQDALLNLVTNAIDACPAGREGCVTLRSRRLDGQSNVCVEVIDNGSGVPLEIADKIYNLFFSTKGQKGTGIGLAATRKIVEEHGGSIEFENLPSGGALFRVFLPREDDGKSIVSALAEHRNEGP